MSGMTVIMMLGLACGGVCLWLVMTVSRGKTAEDRMSRTLLAIIAGCITIILGVIYFAFSMFNQFGG